MHEIGMLYQTAKIATEFAEKNNVEKVRYIALEIGELAGVLPEIFKDYFQYVAEQYPKLKQAELKLHIIPGEGVCDECHCMYNVMRNEGKCPRCHSYSKTILSGREVKLLHIGY